MTYTIYALFDSREPERVRYIGFSRNPEQRYEAHLHEAHHAKKRSHRLSWIRKVLSEGGEITWRALTTVTTAEDAARIEIACISEHLLTGHPLTNGTKGGEGVQGFGGVLSPEAAARKAETVSSPEWSAKRSKLSSRYWASEQAREQHRQALKDWHATEDEAQKEARIDKIRAAVTGHKHSDETRAKMAAQKLGKPQMPRTPEWKARISAAQKGKPRPAWSEERKAAHKARLNDPVTKMRMSESAKARGSNR